MRWRSNALRLAGERKMCGCWRRVVVGSLVGLASALGGAEIAAPAAQVPGSPAPPAGRPALNEDERTRVEAEATGQAAEADRLLKAGNYAAALPLYKAERSSRALRWATCVTKPMRPEGSDAVTPDWVT